MIKFPVLNWLRIDDYALYPGKPAEPGLFADFSTNLNLVVGANGLGKSTLLTIAFRMLTGPFDIPGAARTGELGSARLTVSPLRTNGEFSARVSDGATRAQAAISFALGPDEFMVVRSLQNQRLVSWSLNGEVGEPRETDLQAEIASACGVYSFADWILVLRYVTFYMDDRQVLFWDHSAQKQLLRSLFLPPAEAKEWVNRERRVLEIDSKHRNRRAALTQAKRDLAKQVDPGSDDHASLRARLLQLLDESEKAAALAEAALEKLSVLEGELATANLDRLRAEVEADKVFKSYEQSKMRALADIFPSAADSARFVWSQLLSEEFCLTCGSHVPGLAADLEARITASLCAVCGSPVEDHSASPDRLGAVTWSTVQVSHAAVREAERQYQELTSRVSDARRSVALHDREREDKEDQIDSVNARLPASDEAYLKHRSQVRVFESLLESAAVELEEAATDFDSFVEARSVEILRVADQLKTNFERYARSFLLDEGELAWSAREETIGQSKYKVAFPAYELRLRRNDGGNVSIRSGPGDVSESQKEFIDLAFRMALVQVAGVEATATILIDTPESSLDAVFSSKAAGVLSDFVSGDSKSHIVVASNLTDGPLIPALVRSVKAATGEVSVLNLLEVARPTPAIEQLGGEYDAAYQRLLRDTGLVSG